MVEPETAGCPATGARWVRTRLRGLSAALGKRARPATIGRLLRANGSGPRGHRKRLTGPAHADRGAQFRSIHAPRRPCIGAVNPWIGAGAKERELVGQFKNPGRRWCRRPTGVSAHDFPDDATCRATPSGVDDPERDLGRVCVGTSGNTADLAAASIRDWWGRHGRRHDPGATAPVVEADGGGSNGATPRRFERRPQRLAGETGLAVTAGHYP